MYLLDMAQIYKLCIIIYRCITYSINWWQLESAHFKVKCARNIDGLLLFVLF